MNARTALIACIFTILLSAAAYWLLRTAPQAPPTGPELPPWVRTLDSTPLTGLALTHAAQPGRSELVRSADLPLFVLQANATQPAWPIDETRIRSAARLIADSAKAAAGAPGLFTPGYTVTWTTPAGPQSLTLSDAPSWLGGFAQLRFDAAAASPVLRVQTDLAKLFTPEALLAWRSPTIFPALQASEAGGVSIQTLAGIVSLKKSGAQWGMPDYRINADADAVAQMVRTLTALGATRLIGVADAAASQTTPTMILEMRSSVNSVAAGSQEVTRRVLVQSVRVFGAADGSGKTLLAVAQGAWEESPDQPLWGPMQLAINAADIATIPTDAAKLASRVLLDVPAADAGGGAGIGLEQSRGVDGEAGSQWLVPQECASQRCQGGFENGAAADAPVQDTRGTRAVCAHRRCEGMDDTDCIDGQGPACDDRHCYGR
ncbi:MAG: hypothetical protein NTV94_09115 [Planctomycetota bacterium]|nr:hypothetical protein [Planctomycetota bacterium]